MPSNAFNGLLVPLLEDVEELNAAYAGLDGVVALRHLATEALCRAAVVACISAWEAFVEELVREALQALRTPIPHAGYSQALNQLLEDELSRFNTPSGANVQSLIRRTVGGDRADFFTRHRSGRTCVPRTLSQYNTPD